MKDHVQERRSIYLEGPINDVINQIKKTSEGLIDPEIEIEYKYADYESDSYYIVGLRPMTETEQNEATRKRECDRKAVAKRKKEVASSERANAIKLLKKYPDIINEIKD